MHHKYTEINLDKSLLVRFKTIYKNSLVLHFKFYNKDSESIDVSQAQFKFVVTDAQKTQEFIVVNNADWIRDSTNEIKHIITSLNIVPDDYKVDFTITYSDGRIQTLMDGEFIVRDRYIL